MHVLMVNGSPHKEGCTNRALGEISKTLEGHGVTSEIFWIGRNPIRGCQACGKCSQLDQNRCVFSDDVVNALIDCAAEADGIIVGSPVFYSGANGALTAVLDRAFYAGGSVMRFKPAAAVASARRAGTTATLERLDQYFLINCMPIVPSTYWNMVHGSRAEDVEQDLEGLQTMRNLAHSMAWLLECISAGTALEFDRPQIEIGNRTNFIR